MARTSSGTPQGQGVHEQAVQHNVLTRLQQAVNVYRGDFLEGFYVGDAQQLTRQAADAPLHVASASTAIAPSDLFRLSLQLGWAYELSSQFAQATSIYQEMLTLAQEMGESEMECMALNRLANLAARYNTDLTRTEELLHQALIVAESSQHTASVAETSWNLAQTGFYAGKMAASLPYAERALALARELNLQELIARSLHAPPRSCRHLPTGLRTSNNVPPFSQHSKSVLC